MLASKYLLTKELGRGGMGAVWAAHNIELDADVAVKVLRSDVGGEGLHVRLLREARAVAKLGHPNIVRVFDIGHAADGTPFLVMELLRGSDLLKAIKARKRLDVVSAVRCLLPIANALACAHEAGFVHRDLKPENIFLAEQPGSPARPILLDFGIALSWSEPSHRLTQEGTTVGSPTYMSPEQSRGDEATHRSDIWAFSVVLYEAVTGQVPFSNTNLPRLQRDIIAKPARTFENHGIIEADLWAIVERGLAKNPVKRWRNMRTMGLELARWLLKQGVEEDATNTSIRATWLEGDRTRRVLTPVLASAPPDALPSLADASEFTDGVPRFSKRRRWLVVGAILLGLGIGTVLWSLWGPMRSSRPEAMQRPSAGGTKRAPPGMTIEPLPATRLGAAIPAEAPANRQAGPGQELPTAAQPASDTGRARRQAKGAAGRLRSAEAAVEHRTTVIETSTALPRALDIKTEF